MKSVWKTVKTSVKERVPAHSYKMWIEPLRIDSIDNDTVHLFCPNHFSKKRLELHYVDLIRAEFEAVAGRPQVLQFEVKPLNKTHSDVEPDQQLCFPGFHQQPHMGRLLRKDFTFDQFVVANNNDFAYSASLSLASGRANQQNALYLLSKTGNGKSHLSQAVGHHILHEFPREKVYYITAEDFTNEMVEAYRTNTIGTFKKKYRNGCDVLLLEDVHYLSGKKKTQLELAFTLDTLVESGSKVIFTSCYLPNDIPKLSDELRSRLTCGIISVIETPDFKTRVKILRKKATVRQAQIPDQVIEYLADALSENVRQLESGLIGVTARSSLMGSPVDMDLAQTVVDNIALHKKRISIGAIKKLVCGHYNIRPDEIVSSSRKRAIVKPRQVAMYLSRKYTDAPLQAIGRSFNRYHATALHAIGKVEKGIKRKGRLHKQVEFLSQKLESGQF